jgi:hypothetical protein
MNNDVKWHAEAVAVQIAEKMYGGTWPVGSKVATYRRLNSSYLGPMSSCAPGASLVLIPCSV